MTIARSRPVTRLASAGLLLALFACGEDTSPTTPPTPAAPTPVPPTPPPASLIIEGEEALSAPTARNGSRLAKWDFALPVPGTLEATIGYQYDTSRILVWITDRLCNKWQFERDECFYITKSLAGARPRTLTASGVRAGTYSLFVANDGPYPEVIGYKVTLLPGSNGEGRLTSEGRLTRGAPASAPAP